MSTFSKPIQAAGLVVWLIISFAASAIGAAASVQAGPFYDQLVRPDWGTAALDIRAGLDGPVCADGYFRLARVARWRHSGRKGSVGLVSRPAGGQCTTELAVLRLARGRPGDCR